MVTEQEFSSPYRRFYTKDRTWEQLVKKAREEQSAKKERDVPIKTLSSEKE